MKPCGILRRIVVVNMRFVTLRYKFTKKQWIYWISWIPDQIFWSMDMAWSQTRTIRSKADRNFNPRKFRGKSIQIYVFRTFFYKSWNIQIYPRFCIDWVKISMISCFLRPCMGQNPAWSHSFFNLLTRFQFWAYLFRLKVYLKRSRRFW